MASPEPDVRRQRCGVHPDRAAVERCASCTRPVCLSCAIPVRGRVLCASCASRELGTPAPPARAPSSRRPELVAGGLLLLGLAATGAPWHGSGTLTSAFSAWLPEPDPWPLVACLSLLAGAIAAIGPLLLGSGPQKLAAMAYAALATVAAAATARALLGAPDYFSPTPAPFAAFTLALAAAGVGFARLSRLPGRA